MAGSKPTSPERCIERFEDDIAALQIKVSVLEKLLLTSEAMYEDYNRMVDELGIAYVKEREAVRKTVLDTETASVQTEQLKDRTHLN